MIKALSCGRSTGPGAPSRYLPRKKIRRATEDLALILSGNNSGPACHDEIRNIINKGIDWNYFQTLVHEHSLIGHVYNFTRDQSLFPEEFAELKKKLKPHFFRTLAGCCNYENCLSRIASSFNSENIPFIPLKGTIFSRYIYNESWIRGIIFDIDLLVPENERVRARENLTRLGYRLREEEVEPWEFQMNFVNERMLPVDLHWDITEKHRTPSRMAAFWEDTTEIDVDGIKYRVFRPESMLLFLFAHLSNVSAFTEYRHICDANRLLDVYADDIDWDNLKEKARNCSLSNSLYAGLLALKVLFGRDYFKKSKNLPPPPFFKKFFISLCIRKSAVFYSGAKKFLCVNYLKYIYYELVESENMAKFLKILWEYIIPPRSKIAENYKEPFNPILIGTLYIRRFFKAAALLFKEKKHLKQGRTRVINIFLAFLLLLSSASCTTSYHHIGKKDTSVPPPLKKEQLTGTILYADYYIAPGDRLEIHVWQYPEWSNQTDYGSDWTRDTVRPDGKLWFPLIGDVECAGLSLEQLAEKLEEKLSKYIRSPEVDVYVREYAGRYYYVLNSSGGGGKYIINRPIDILEAVVEGGGLSGISDLDSVILITDNLTDNPKMRRVDIFKRMRKGVRKEDVILIKPNDIIYIPTRFIPEFSQAVGEIQAAVNSAEWLIGMSGWSGQNVTPYNNSPYYNNNYNNSRNPWRDR